MPNRRGCLHLREREVLAAGAGGVPPSPNTGARGKMPSMASSTLTEHRGAIAEPERSAIAWGVAAVSIALAWSSLAIKLWFGMVLGVEDTALILPGLLAGTAFAVVGALIAARTGNAAGRICPGLAGFGSISL